MTRVVYGFASETAATSVDDRTRSNKRVASVRISVYDQNREPLIGRRRTLGLFGTVAVSSIAGCLGETDTPEPVDLDDGQSCDNCEMVIEDQPGTTGQIFFEENRPDDRDGPAWFCSGSCAYSYQFERLDEGWSPTVTYLTDYSAVDYELFGDGDRISAHLSADAYASDTELSLVVDSDVMGAMGTAIVPFSEPSDAANFVEEHGGETITAEEVSRELVNRM